MAEKPLYNSRIISTFVEYLRITHPHIDIDNLLADSGINSYEIEDEGHWLTQRQVDNFHDVLMEKGVDPSIFREAGRYMAASRSITSIRQFVIGFITPIHAYTMLEKVASYLNRGVTFKANKISPNKVEIITKAVAGVDEKLYQCENRQGSLEAVAKLFTNRLPALEHPVCMHKGGLYCQYVISWEEPVFFKWKRLRNYLALSSIFLIILADLFLPPLYLASFAFLIIGGTIGSSLYADYIEKKDIYARIEGQGNAANRLLDQITIGYSNAILVQEIGQAVSSVLDIDQLLKLVMDTLQKHLHFDRGMIMLANPARTRLVYVQGFGYNPSHESLLKETTFSLDNPQSRGPLVAAFKEQKPFLIDNIGDFRTDLSLHSYEFVEKLGVTSFICVPIVYKGESEGVLAVDNYRSMRPHSQSEVSLLMGIAPQIAISINNIRAIQQIKNNEERFYQASKMEALGTLTGGISHDFNNIVQAISSYNQLLLMKKTDADPDRNYLLNIEKLTQRASDLIKQLLLFSRKGESKLEPVDLNGEVKKFYELMLTALPPSIEVTMDLDDELCLINGDSTQLGQVIMNLTINARDAMPEGGKITISTRNTEIGVSDSQGDMPIKAGKYVVLSVCDTGTGIDKDVLPHIFDPFFTTKEAGKGTGIGLAVVYGIAKTHHGQILCDSKPGQGARFDFYIPALDVDVMESENDVAAKQTAAAGSGTILLIDDESALLETNSDFLSFLGYNVLTAQSGEEALAFVSRERISLVILDLMMPGMGGEKCLMEIKKIAPDLKVIVASGFSAHLTVRDILNKGAAAFIPKPYRFEDLSEKIEEVLKVPH